MTTTTRGGPRRGPEEIHDEGAEGNERLTSITGAVLLVLLAVEGVTIVFIGRLISVHVFVGLLLLGPVGLKLASTGYRFLGYYSARAAYRRKGPPATPLRLLAIPLVLSTVAVFATGVALVFVDRRSGGDLRLIHKVSFIVWVGVFAIHVLAHLGGMFRSLIGEYGRRRGGVRRGHGRRAAGLLAGLLAGLIIALVLSPRFHGGHGGHDGRDGQVRVGPAAIVSGAR